MWRLPRRVLLYVLVVDVAALCMVPATARAPVSVADIRMAAALACATIVHLHLSKVIERIRRDHSHTPHVDLGWIWIFPGALLLPPLLAAALAVLVCGHRWWLVGRYDAARRPYRHLFNISMLVLAALAASGVVAVSGRYEQLSSGPGGWIDLTVVVLAAAASWTTNAALVAGVIGLTTTVRRPGDLIGGAGDNLLDVGTLLLGAFVALAMAWWPPFAVLMVLPAVALHRTVLIHQLELAARSDDKTGVLNAVAWTQQARAELLRTRRHGGSMAIFMIDLDGFKQVNDGHGHLVGDLVLQRVARVLSGEVRRTDAVGRFGGDEFVILLPATGVTDALVIAERVRQQIRQLPVPAVTGLSTSIGVAVYPQVTEDTLEGLLAAADAALYLAKANGRDQIRLADRYRSVPWLPATRRSGHDRDCAPWPAPTRIPAAE